MMHEEQKVAGVLAVLDLAIAEAEHKPGDWKADPGMICAPWARFSYARDGQLAMAAVNALPVLMGAVRGQLAQVEVPINCRQRLMLEGKPIKRSHCDACGPMSPKWRECDAALAAQQQGSVAVPDLRSIVTEALVSMIAAITGLTQPAGDVPPFIQAAIDRAVERISAPPAAILTGGEA